MPSLVIVEDDPLLRRTLAISLSARHFTVHEAGNAKHGLEFLDSRSPDLLIVDLGLPDMDGVTLIERVRATSNVPVIVLSARSSQSQKVDALEAGADDYLTKPFGLEELVARIRATLRRTKVPRLNPVVTTESFTLDFDARRAVVNGESVRLTPIEWRLIEVLARRPGRLVSSQDLLAEVWGPGAVHQIHYLRVYLSHLRRKLENDPAAPRHFVTVSGEGYRFDA